MQEIDILEGASDYVFLYFFGYGNNLSDTSYIAIASINTITTYIMFDELANYVDKFESTNIFTVVESCHSGGFVANLKGPNRFIISSTSTVHNAFGDPITKTPYFSNFFFAEILNFESDIDAFLLATVIAIPLSLFRQWPQFNDQLPYTWFLT